MLLRIWQNHLISNESPKPVGKPAGFLFVSFSDERAGVSVLIEITGGLVQRLHTF